MEISIGSCAYLGQCSIYSGADTGDGTGGTPVTTTPKYSTGNKMTVGRSGLYYTGIIKFRTPDVPGSVSQYLDFKLPVYGYSNNVRLHYALCVSDSNYAKYYNTYNNVSDTNQILRGSITSSNIKTEIEGSYGRFYLTLFIDTQQLKPNTVYYLFIWSATSSDNNHIDVWRNGHAQSVSLKMGYVIGAVHIDNGTVLEMHQCYIDNGSGWDMYIPYIDNGTNWEMYN